MEPCADNIGCANISDVDAGRPQPGVTCQCGCCQDDEVDQERVR